MCPCPIKFGGFRCVPLLSEQPRTAIGPERICSDLQKFEEARARLGHKSYRKKLLSNREIDDQIRVMENRIATLKRQKKINAAKCARNQAAAILATAQGKEKQAEAKMKRVAACSVRSRRRAQRVGAPRKLDTGGASESDDEYKDIEWYTVG